MLLMNLCGFTVVPLQLCWCLACSSASLRPASSACMFTSISHPFPKFCISTQKKFVVPGKNASLTLIDCLCSKTFCKILDKAAEDLSNLRSFSESQKLDEKYLIEHGYSSMKLPYYNSFNFNCILQS